MSRLEKDGRDGHARLAPVVSVVAFVVFVVMNQRGRRRDGAAARKAPLPSPASPQLAAGGLPDVAVAEKVIAI